MSPAATIPLSFATQTMSPCRKPAAAPFRSTACVPDRLYWGRHRLARERGGRSEPGGVASLYCAAVSLRQHFAVFRSFAWLIVLSVATAVTASIALTAIVPRLYEARATLSVGQSLGSEAIDYDDLLASQALGRTYARLATTQPLLSAVIERTGFEVSTSDLAKKVDRRFSRTTRC